MRGHIRKRPSGAWEIAFDADYVVKDGKRRSNRKFITRALPSMQKDAAAKACASKCAASQLKPAVMSTERT